MVDPWIRNRQVKDNKIDLLAQQYEQFTILEDESIDSGFARFNTIITSLKAIDEGFSSKNYVRKFLRALHPKWRAKVTAIEESKDLSSLALDGFIRNLKVHEVVMEKDFEIYRGKKERVKSIALKAKKESSDDENLTPGSNQDKKRSHSDKGMRRKERMIENSLDAVIQIISLAIVQNHLTTKIKRLSLEVLGAIAKIPIGVSNTSYSGLIVPVFQKWDDPIDAINHMMSFLTAVVTSRYPTTNNQLRTSSNPRQQATSSYYGKIALWRISPGMAQSTHEVQCKSSNPYYDCIQSKERIMTSSEQFND
ncbi:hypothetical protein Tco_0519472 [Tanacetum coccineum]